jgi:hypothetical protein
MLANMQAVVRVEENQYGILGTQRAIGQRLDDSQVDHRKDRKAIASIIAHISEHTLQSNDGFHRDTSQGKCLTPAT